jgi:hypothetical protein|tara:strand:+ start:580 stop:708 length:129 start_codon:yes stop_codon:yes gene_type:complete
MVNSAQNKIKKYFKEKNPNVFTNFTLARFLHKDFSHVDKKST